MPDGRSLRLFINCVPGVFTDHESNGEGLIVRSLASGLAERGHKIHVLAGRVAVKGELHPNLTVAATGPHRLPINSFAPSEYMARGDAYLSDLLRRESFDLMWRYYGSGTPRPPRTYGLPLVMGPLHYAWPVEAGSKAAAGGKPRLGIGLGPLADRLYERGFKAALSKADMLLCETEPNAEAMRRRYPQAMVGMLPLIVRVPKEASALPEHRTLQVGGTRPTLRLLFAANLLPNKRTDVFCRTVGALRKRHGVDAEGIVLGDGPERAQLETLCRDTPEIGDAVQFRGRVPNDAVYTAVGDADLFVSTSIGEPYGRSIVEAMAMGTPPVCHRSGGPGDFIDDGRTGILVDVMDPDAYADSIARVSKDPALWADLSANARHLARTEWTEEVILERLETLFDRLCKKR